MERPSISRDEAGRVDSHQSGNSNAQNPQSYATRIKEHADRPSNIDIHSGFNYRALAAFLNKVSVEQRNAVWTEAEDGCGPSLVCVHRAVEEGGQATRLYRSISDCHKFAINAPSLTNNAAQLIWLSGFPTGQWINVIGAQYRIDPEFFRRHLIFLQSRDYHGIATMPSSTQRMLTIRLTTIWRRPIVLSRPAIENARSEAAELVRQHQQKLSVGDSIVRKYSVFNNSAFTIEQEIAVYVERSKQHNGWIAIICSDIGRDLSKGPPGPWHIDMTGMAPSCEPVVMHVPKLALERPPRARVLSNGTNSNNTGQMPQNASLLAETFSLPPASDSVRLDIRDALHDIFAFAAAAECQFLAMMQGLVDQELQLQATGKQTDWTLSNLRYFKSAVDDHIVNVENMLVFLRRSDVPRWSPHTGPCMSRDDSSGVSQLPLYLPSLRGGASSGESSYSHLSCLVDDYTHLLQNATRLSNRCVENTTILMNMTMLEESRKAIIQADDLKRLTLLTFFFLPLSLTTSIFGMNVKGFGTGGLSIWVCFCFGVPVLSLSFVLCFWEAIRESFEQRLKPSIAAFVRKRSGVLEFGS